jgi:hypothetical protein
MIRLRAIPIGQPAAGPCARPNCARFSSARECFSDQTEDHVGLPDAGGDVGADRSEMPVREDAVIAGVRARQHLPIRWLVQLHTPFLPLSPPGCDRHAIPRQCPRDIQPLSATPAQPAARLRIDHRTLQSVRPGIRGVSAEAFASGTLTATRGCRRRRFGVHRGRRPEFVLPAESAEGCHGGRGVGLVETRGGSWMVKRSASCATTASCTRSTPGPVACEPRSRSATDLTACVCGPSQAATRWVTPASCAGPAGRLMPELPAAVTGQLDAVVGAGVEAAVVAKHARRLQRLGWSRALDPSSPGTWAQGGPPPRGGCALDVLIEREGV